MRFMIRQRARVAITCLFIFMALTGSLFARQDDLSPLLGVENVSVGGEWFISYENGQFRGGEINRFLLNRGYIVIEKQINNWLSTRITPDVSVDEEGDGRGDIEMRMKYLHLKAQLNDIGFIARPYVEVGIAHRPWLAFEEHINTYRVQGTMFLERQKIFNSADFGVSFFGLLGGEMDSTCKKTVGKYMPGRYGSFAFGVFNGGGYHAIEENNNKSIEGRLSLRPFPDVLPGLQFSYTGAYGKGNIAQEPEWQVHAGFISYEAARFVATAQYFTGLGNSSGSYVDAGNNALRHDGYSFFCEYKMPRQKMSLFARYDFWNGDKIEYDTDRVIGGVAYHFAKKCKIVLNYDYFTDGAENAGPLTSLIKIDMLVKF